MTQTLLPASKFSQEDFARLGSIVQKLTGNQILEKHHPMLESRLGSRLARLGLNISQYWSYYETHKNEENEALVSLMTTHYTFFFREYVHFEKLQEWIDENKEYLVNRYRQSKSPLRVWSAACSRGQEVYSLAMFLEESLLAKYGVEYEIYGSDIDEESVRYAQNGVYPLKEVHSIPQHLLNAFWKKGTGSVKDFAAVHPKLKSKVSFGVKNLLQLDSIKDVEKFDIIFVRNVFIYFSEENVKKIALDLVSTLNSRGVLVSGLSEPLRFDGWSLSSRAPSFYERSGADIVEKSCPASPNKSLEQSSPISVPKKADHEVGQKSYRVLCVDDSKTIQSLMKKMFSDDPNCLEVVSAYNGVEAFELLAKQSFDLITLDIHMPIMGGIEFLEKHYDSKKHPPVIMVSSVNRGDADLAVKALSLGAFDYVEKPAMNNLQESTDEIINKAHLAIKRRSLKLLTDPKDLSFSTSVAQKIVVPDASQSLRWIFSDLHSDEALEFLMKSLDLEERSPPLLVMLSERDLAAFEAKVQRWASGKFIKISEAKMFLKPNSVYLCDDSVLRDMSESWKEKNVSLQFLAQPKYDISPLRFCKGKQVLLDEQIDNAELRSLFSRMGLDISDVTPATSFVSLSLEYFANLRKAKAA